MRVMRRNLIVLSAAAVLAVSSLPGAGGRAAWAAPPPKASCKGCHADFASVLPKGHPAVKGTAPGACASCHAPDLAAKKKENAYSARMHRAHVPPKGELECTACHTWVPGKRFGLIGRKGSFGAPDKEQMALLKEIFASWAGSEHTAGLHAEAGIVCSQCHGKGLPTFDDTVENAGCLRCHGPMEQLAKKSEPKEFKDRNPHKSHLGEIACTVCHKGHMESKVYCLDCHKQFEMKIPGAAKR